MLHYVTYADAELVSGDSVWYVNKDGLLTAAILTKLDCMDQSCEIVFEEEPGHFRQTEASRLRPRRQTSEPEQAVCRCPTPGCQAVMSHDQLQVICTALLAHKDEGCACMAPSMSSMMEAFMRAIIRLACSMIASTPTQALAPVAHRMYCEAANEAFLRASGIINCPNCQAFIERLRPPGQYAELIIACCPLVIDASFLVSKYNITDIICIYCCD